ncbi:prepilin peptidase CpaA [Novosphingobium mathurense]|uniref:Prepilin peptidase CpaA n=1 Tax=Novosphingobium mathurense TaxID=428990 RepID=A0A1U6GT40_9SPHN|nr:prepilin peptidase [Novosphingobium sp. KN65.2]CDO37524.1 Type IV prepilin peptidase, cpaA [Novosphingobium sp. KN65.2]SLJ86689.1 prepilin peptidase CpaA [Novosphingobium mathurense]
MQGGYFSYALLAALATALLYAAYTDVKRREIDNWLNAAIALCAPVWWYSAGYGWADVGFQLGLAVLTFIVTCFLFAMRQMGGGDVKLLTALAFWFSPAAFVQLIVMMGVIGGGASVAMAFFNMRRVPGEVVRDVLAGVTAIAWVWCACLFVYAMATRQPLVDPETLATVGSFLPQPWTIALAIVAVLAFFAFGFRHMLRRQKSRLPIPYGVAISLAGLWVLSEQAYSAALLS